MTKKLWTSLVLGLTLSSPALMVGCGEEAPKVDATKADTPVVVAPADAKTPATTPVTTPASTPTPAK